MNVQFPEDLSGIEEMLVLEDPAFHQYFHVYRDDAKDNHTSFRSTTRVGDSIELQASNR
jgi:hypothetical protein